MSKTLQQRFIQWHPVNEWIQSECSCNVWASLTVLILYSAQEILLHLFFVLYSPAKLCTTLDNVSLSIINFSCFNSLPDRSESHHVVPLPLLPLQVLLCVFKLVWHQPQFGLHVADNFLQIRLWGECPLAHRTAGLPFFCQLANELGVHCCGSS